MLHLDPASRPAAAPLSLHTRCAPPLPRPPTSAVSHQQRLQCTRTLTTTPRAAAPAGSPRSGVPPPGPSSPSPSAPSAPSKSPSPSAPERLLASPEASAAELRRIAAAVEALAAAAAAGPGAPSSTDLMTDLAALLQQSAAASAAAAEQQAAALGRLERQAKERAAAAAGQTKLIKELLERREQEAERAREEARVARLQAALAVQCSAKPPEDLPIVKTILLDSITSNDITQPVGVEHLGPFLPSNTEELKDEDVGEAYRKLATYLEKLTGGLYVSYDEESDEEAVECERNFLVHGHERP
ncbi:hypothetical protein HYH03_002804 [Edaphochlamys debaryana]|uniref:Uncharacterized protein n=1 Tax=Edaphochlamys debaryana TaxID=47281 RepID=A0A836C4X2_9CHLO|nr:hypothetical protein HYH03_002804 [Edaphochlamys debaryana]|eukprot:KAG2499224.1 hypothetical protein HYH03_002804 [Edaphochlamys debaryana]